MKATTIADGIALWELRHRRGRIAVASPWSSVVTRDQTRNTCPLHCRQPAEKTPLLRDLFDYQSGAPRRRAPSVADSLCRNSIVRWKAAVGRLGSRRSS
jgi:hypothetical protein